MAIQEYPPGSHCVAKNFVIIAESAALKKYAYSNPRIATSPIIQRGFLNARKRNIIGISAKKKGVISVYSHG